MKRGTIERAVLAIVCTLALLLIPASLAWAQSSATSTQQDQSNRVDENRSDQDVNRDSAVAQDKDVNQDNSVKSDADRDINLEKPSTPAIEQNSTQEQNQNRGVVEPQTIEPRATESQVTEPQTRTDSHSTTEQNKTTPDTAASAQIDSRNTQTESNREGLPATAGELPLLALVGILSLASAAGTRLLARAKR